MPQPTPNMLYYDRFISLKAAVEKVSPNHPLRNIYTMGCPLVRGDNPRALASGLSYLQVDRYGLTVL